MDRCSEGARGGNGVVQFLCEGGGRDAGGFCGPFIESAVAPWCCVAVELAHFSPEGIGRSLVDIVVFPLRAGSRVREIQPVVMENFPEAESGLFGGLPCLGGGGVSGILGERVCGY